MVDSNPKTDVGVVAEQARNAVDAVYRSDSRRILATLIRLLGDFDLAEDALHDAFAVAMEQWPRDGVPANPRAWLVSAAASKRSTHFAAAPGSTGRSRSSRRISMPARVTGWRGMM